MTSDLGKLSEAQRYLLKILAFADASHSSDIHLCTQKVPYLRTMGSMEPLGLRKEWVSHEALREMLDLLGSLRVKNESASGGKIGELRAADMFAAVEQHGYFDFSSNLKYAPTAWNADWQVIGKKITERFKLANFAAPEKILRTNVIKDSNGYGFITRLLPDRIPSLRELGFDDQHSADLLDWALSRHQGFILVTGGTGSGKSTTLAAIIEHLSKTGARNIITLESPIEYLHKQYTPQDPSTEEYKSLIKQREIPTHCPTFTAGIVSALRGDPDVIMVGEIRDQETIRAALTAAETGHLVLGTLHANSCVSTLSRIMNEFPPDEQNLVREQLASRLTAVISQTLVKCSDLTRCILCYEILTNQDEIPAALRQELKNVEQNRSAKNSVRWNDTLSRIQGQITAEDFDSLKRK